MKKVFRRHPNLQRLLVVAGVGAVLLVIAVIFFPWDMLRGSVNRYVSEQLGRRFEITQRLAVNLGLTTSVRLEGLEFANPDWAVEPYFVKAKAAEFDIKLWPLIFGRVVIPRIALFEPQVGLQKEADGRKSWALSRDTSNENATAEIGTVTADRGKLTYREAKKGADISTQFSLDADDAKLLPLRFEASGKWHDASFTANGRAGSILALSRDIKESFPMEINAQSGKTQLRAKGVVNNLQEFEGLNASFDLQGRNLEELYKIAGVVLPSTPPYKLQGQLSMQNKVWAAGQIRGVLGSSDISGDMRFDISGGTPLLTGKIQSKVLDFADLLPVIGLPVKTSATPANINANVKANANTNASLKADTNSDARPAATATATVKKSASAVSDAGLQREKLPAKGRVLPTATLDFNRLKSMNADVVYSAADVRHAAQLPIDKGNVHIRLNKGVLQLDPVVLGVAGGSLAGQIKVDVNVLPAAFDTRFDLRAVALNQLFPTIQSTKSSLGKVSGQVALKGRGNSMAQMLGTASGDVAMLTGKGEISNILLEFLGLDGGEIIKFFLRGDRNVTLRCAAAAFDVKQGLMSSKVILLDTSDTVINGQGQINLANETLDIDLKPEPKDKSILSLRSPLKISGTFAAPSAGPDKVALGARAGLAIALGVVNPFLALLATIETGPGQDADCTGAMATAKNVSNTKPNDKPAAKTTAQ